MESLKIVSEVVALWEAVYHNETHERVKGAVVEISG